MAIVILFGSLTLIIGLILSVLDFNLGVAVEGAIANIHLKATGPSGLVFLGAALQWIGASKL